MVKRLAHNECIVGSSPTQRIDRWQSGRMWWFAKSLYDKYRGFESLSIQKLCGGMVYTLDLKSSASAYGFKSHHSQCPIAQLVERLSDKQKVIGSIPIRTITRLAQ